MTRKEGIIKAWQLREDKQKYLTPQIEIFETEYQNYCENCDYCHEEPLTKAEWLEQPIRQQLTTN